MDCLAVRDFHRYHSTNGTEVEISDVCLDCGYARKDELEFGARPLTWDDHDHTCSRVLVGETVALAAKNEVVLLAAMERAVIARRLA